MNSSWPCSGRERLIGFGSGGGRGSGLGLRIPPSGRDGDDDIPRAELSKSLDKDDGQEAVEDRDRKWNMINKYEFCLRQLARVLKILGKRWGKK